MNAASLNFKGLTLKDRKTQREIAEHFGYKISCSSPKNCSVIV